jgi:hypothetical protein
MSVYRETHDQLADAATVRGWKVLPERELSPGYGLLEVRRPGEAIVVSWSPSPNEKHMVAHAQSGHWSPIYNSFNLEDIFVYVRNLLSFESADAE